jgi:hypothetical protein
MFASIFYLSADFPNFYCVLLSIFLRIFQYAGGDARTGGWRRRGASQETQEEKVSWQHHSKAS